MAIRDNLKGEQKEHKLFNNNITGKEFGKDDNDGKDAMIWRNREIDWYNAERRFIFASNSIKKNNKVMTTVLKQKM